MDRSAALLARPQDPFSRWAALQAWSTDGTNRLDAAEDLAFWERAADHYDEESLARRVPTVLERLTELIPRGASVLDIGAGTGAFAIPLAARASRITALDYSPAMLQVLRSKLQASPAVRNVHPVQARWEEAGVEPHDVALAVNALYRCLDLREALEPMIQAAKRRGIVVWSVGRQDEPQAQMREKVHPDRYRPGPDYIHVVEGLFALGVFARVELIEVDDTQRFLDEDEAIEGLLSWSPVLSDERARAAHLLPHLLERQRESAEPERSWAWRRRGRIAIIWWDHP